jgi:large subunit ribosomal protein L17
MTVRHRKHHTKLSRPTGHRNALLRNLAGSLILSKDRRIETTVAKAKALQPFVESLLTHGKKGTLHHRRLAFAKLGNKQAVTALFESYAPVFQERNGGYTRLIRTRRREGDGAEMAFLEFVEKPEVLITTKRKTEAQASAGE